MKPLNKYLRIERLNKNGVVTLWANIPYSEVSSVTTTNLFEDLIGPAGVDEVIHVNTGVAWHVVLADGFEIKGSGKAPEWVDEEFPF